MMPPFIINLLFLTFIFLMAQILDITNMIVNYNTSLMSVILLLFFSMPGFLEFTIPMSTMMGVLLAFLQMSNDNEIIALKAGGITIYRLLPPVILFCLFGFFLTLFITLYGVSWGNLSYKQLALDIAATSVEVGLKERTFNDSFEGLMLYVHHIDLRDKSFKDIFIEDQRDEKMASTVIAPRGKMLSGPMPLSYTLKLSNGLINRTNLKDRSVHTIRFDTYEINMNLNKAFAKKKKKKKKQEEMTMAELTAFIGDEAHPMDDRNAAVMKLHEKFSIPFACIALGILAMPLGLQSVSFKKSSGIGLGLIFFMMYYIMLAAGWSLGESGTYPPSIAMWVPNIVMFSIGMFLLVRTVREGPTLFVFLFRRIRRLGRTLAGRITARPTK